MPIYMEFAWPPPVSHSTGKCINKACIFFEHQLKLQLQCPTIRHAIIAPASEVRRAARNVTSDKCG